MTTDWSIVYREVYPDLVRFLYRKIWDEERAKDLAQDSGKGTGAEKNPPRISARAGGKKSCC